MSKELEKNYIEVLESMSIKVLTRNMMIYFDRMIALQKQLTSVASEIKVIQEVILKKLKKVKE